MFVGHCCGQLLQYRYNNWETNKILHTFWSRYLSNSSCNEYIIYDTGEIKIEYNERRDICTKINYQILCLHEKLQKKKIHNH